MSYRFADSLRATTCQQICMTYTIAVCTVKNSWWWTEELFETCRVLFQNKFDKLVHLVGFIIRIWHKHCSIAMILRNAHWHCVGTRQSSARYVRHMEPTGFKALTTEVKCCKVTKECRFTCVAKCGPDMCAESALKYLIFIKKTVSRQIDSIWDSKSLHLTNKTTLT